MRRSTFAQPLPDVFAAEAATGYRRGGVAVPGRFHTYPEMAAAGLWTTPGDLARWIVAVQRAHAGAVAPSVALLPRRLAVAMLTPGIGNWGLGVGIEGEGDARRFVHGGANEGFRGLFAGYVTGGRGVVVMTNSDVGGPIAAEMVAAVAREYGWPGYEQREIVALALDSARAAEYLGRFGRPGGAAVLTVERGGEDLAVVGPAGARWELVATGADAFVLLPDGAPVRFERDSTGRVTAVVVGTSDRLTRVP